ncbi:hypothetical protein Egran_06928 [Elaphomyces granulatus]|uniref:Uncharacterized protein n=1 Tax=Elaphomyces granulatus TaxID=519963 RepID=A0A232LMD8_9EURO|nr:hypothetical protein Egran_06928 [Elaphomyces granulatus]
MERSYQGQMALQAIHNASAELQEQLQLAAADSSAVDNLKAQVTELEEKLAIAEEATTAAEQKSKARIEELMNKHSAKLAEIQRERAGLEQKYQITAALQSDHTATRTQLETVLSAIQEELTGIKSTHEQTVNELDVVKARNQELEEKIERESNEQIGKNMPVLAQLTEIDPAISANRKRIPELETDPAALMAKPETNSEPKASGVATSKWATTNDNANEITSPDPAEGEDPGFLAFSVKFTIACDTSSSSPETMMPLSIVRPRPLSLSMQTSPSPFFKKRESQWDRHQHRADVPTPLTNPDPFSPFSSVAPTGPDDMMPGQTRSTTANRASKPSLSLDPTFSRTEIQEANHSTGLESTHKQTFNELDAVKARNQELEEKIGSDERELNDQIDGNTSPLTQHMEIGPAVSADRGRIRQLEAEPAVIKGTNSKPKAGNVATSKWATTNENANENANEISSPDPAEGEDLGFLTFSVKFIITCDTSNPPTEAMTPLSTTWPRPLSLSMQAFPSPFKRRESQWNRYQHRADIPTPLTNPNPFSPFSSVVPTGPDNTMAEQTRTATANWASRQGSLSLDPTFSPTEIQGDLTGLKSTHEQAKARNWGLEEKISSGERELNNQIGRNVSPLTIDPAFTNRKRIRQLEAELATLKAKPKTNSVSKASGVGASKWATTNENVNETTGPDPAEGRDLGYLDFSVKFIITCDTSSSPPETMMPLNIMRPRPLSLSMQTSERAFNRGITSPKWN